MEKVNGCSPKADPLLPEKKRADSLDEKMRKKRQIPESALPAGVRIMLRQPLSAPALPPSASRLSVAPDESRVKTNPSALSPLLGQPEPGLSLSRPVVAGESVNKGKREQPDTYAGPLTAAVQTEKGEQRPLLNPSVLLRRHAEAGAATEIRMDDTQYRLRVAGGDIRDKGTGSTRAESGTDDRSGIPGKATAFRMTDTDVKPDSGEAMAVAAAYAPVKGSEAATASSGEQAAAELSAFLKSHYVPESVPDNARLKFSFNQWGNGHSVLINMSKGGALQMRPSSVLVEQQVSAALKGAGTHTGWEIQALTGRAEAENTGDDE